MDGAPRLDPVGRRRGRCVVSSIGSIPDPIPGLPTKGELLAFDDWDLGRMHAFPTLFGAGNVVTGKGNIVASRKHATQVSEAAVEAYLGVGGEDRAAALEARPMIPEADVTADRVLATLGNAKPPSAEQIGRLRDRVAALQRAVGYGDYKSWMEKVGPPC